MTRFWEGFAAPITGSVATGACLLCIALFGGVSRADAVPSCFGKPATVVGTAGNDQLGGTASRDVIVALGGDDKIRGASGERSDLRGAGGGSRLRRSRGRSGFGGPGGDQLLGGERARPARRRARHRRLHGRRRQEPDPPLRGQGPEDDPGRDPGRPSHRRAGHGLGPGGRGGRRLRSSKTTQTWTAVRMVVESVGSPENGSAEVAPGGVPRVTYAPDPRLLRPGLLHLCAERRLHVRRSRSRSAASTTHRWRSPTPSNGARTTAFSVLPVLENDTDVDGGPKVVESVGSP